MHPAHAVPPVLHTCSEARQVGLKHYNLSFHPRIYINRQYDQLMLHILHPQQMIDFSLYGCFTSGFNWKASPRRFAVLLDDISFHQSNEDVFCSAWKTDPTWRQRLLPFSRDFISTVISTPTKVVEELTLLVLPPLSARPNPTAHRLDLVEGVPDLIDMGEYPTKQLRDRISLFSNCTVAEGDLEPAIQVRVRHATCTSWAPDLDVSWSTEQLQRCSAAEYADMEFGNKPEIATEETTGFNFMMAPPGFHGFADRNDRIDAIQKDLEALKQPFFANVGLGPHVMWERQRAIGKTSYFMMLSSGIRWEADKMLLWVFDHKNAVPKHKLPPSDPFDFDRFLKDPDGFVGDLNLGSGNHRNEAGEKEHGEQEEKETDSWSMRCLMNNRLLHWG